MNPTAVSKPHPPATPARPAPASHLDSPLRTMFGLIILWGSLSLIFWAYQISSNTIQLDVAGGGNGPLATSSMVQSLSPRDILLQSCSLNMLKDSPSNHLASVASTFKLDLQKSSLNVKLGKTPKAFSFKRIPLFRAVHKLIDNREIGYAVRGKTILLYDQKVQTLALDKKQVNWQAEMDLSDEPMLVFPSGDSDWWFSIQLIRDINEASNPWQSMQVELWKGGEKQTTIKQSFDAQGKALLYLSDKKTVSLQVERKATPQGIQSPGSYSLTFNFQSND